MKKSGYLDRFERAKQLEMANVRWFAIQQSKDMMLIAASDAFGFGPERAKRLADAYDKVFFQYAELTIDDAKVDKTIDYTKGKVDERLQKICGKYFEPWEERYR